MRSLPHSPPLTQLWVRNEIEEKKSTISGSGNVKSNEGGEENMALQKTCLATRRATWCLSDQWRLCMRPRQLCAVLCRRTRNFHKASWVTDSPSLDRPRKTLTWPFSWPSARMKVARIHPALCVRVFWRQTVKTLGDVNGGG